jgi:DNA-binding helix-hairpin-helix protein with protein kinase domain
MVRIRSERLARIAAWPTDTLHLQAGGDPIGFVMPRVSGYHDVHLLYGPKTRLTTFPDARWRFLVHASGNVARAFRAVHELGLVVGDVNHGNLLVDQRATVRFIDCDSFQIKAGGRTFPCKVGVETHTPPELQGLDLSTVVRTANHDAFGLAIVIFQLLFLGRHPYSGTFLDRGDMPISRAIAEGRFVYGMRARAVRMQPPPHSLTLASVPVRIADLFERAFDGSMGARPNRPTAAEWVSALEVLEKSIKSCSVDPSHQYAGDAFGCPWCSIESGARVQLFNPVIRPPAGTLKGFDIVAVWAQIDSVISPGPVPPSPTASSSNFRATPEAIREGEERHRRKRVAAAASGIGALLFVVALAGGSTAAGWLIFVAVAFGCAAVVVYRSAPGEVRRNASAHLAAARAEREQLRARLESEAGESSFVAKKAELSRLREEYLGLDKRRSQALQRLSSQAEQMQRGKYLERHRIWQAGIPGIGPERTAMLQSYGIETAADVTANAVAAVPGFGPVLTSTLVAWRQLVEKGFRFDPLVGIDPIQLRNVDHQIQAERNRLASTLAAGIDQLNQTKQLTLTRRTELMAIYAEAASKEAQARADLAAAT